MSWDQRFFYPIEMTGGNHSPRYGGVIRKMISCVTRCFLRDRRPIALIRQAPNQGNRTIRSSPKSLARREMCSRTSGRLEQKRIGFRSKNMIRRAGAHSF